MKIEMHRMKAACGLLLATLAATTCVRAEPAGNKDSPAATTDGRAAKTTDDAPKAAGQIRGPALATVPKPGVTPSTTQSRGPAPPVVQPHVAAPSATKPGTVPAGEAMSEPAKTATKELGKARAFPTDARFTYFSPPPQRLSPLGRQSAASYFCEGSQTSHGIVVAVRYEWRPGDGHVQTANLTIRHQTGRLSVPVRLQAGGGEARSDQPLDRGTLLYLPPHLSKPDVCPSACVDVRLEPRTRADANRFDQRWQRACIRW